MEIKDLIKSAKQPLSIIIFLSFITHAAFNGGRFTALLYTIKLSNNDSLITGLLLALLSFFPMITSITVGKLIDSYDKRYPFAIGSIVLVIANLLPFLFPNLITLFITVILLGNANNIQLLAIQQLISESTNNVPQRIRAFALSSLMISASLMIMPIICGYLITHFSYKLSFILLSILPLIALGALLYLNKNIQTLKGIAPSKTLKQNKNQNSIWSIIKQKNIRNVLLASLSISIAWELHNFVIPLMGKSFNLDASEIGLIIGSFSAGTFLIRLFLSQIAKRFQPWQVIHFAIATGMLIYLIYPFMPYFIVMNLLSLILGIALGSCQPNVLAMIHQVAPVGRGGEVAGARVMIAYGAAMIVPLASGFLSNLFGFKLPFLMIAAIMAIVLIITRQRDE